MAANEYEHHHTIHQDGKVYTVEIPEEEITRQNFTQKGLTTNFTYTVERRQAQPQGTPTLVPTKGGMGVDAHYKVDEQRLVPFSAGGGGGGGGGGAQTRAPLAQIAAVGREVDGAADEAMAASGLTVARLSEAETVFASVSSATDSFIDDSTHDIQAVARGLQSTADAVGRAPQIILDSSQQTAAAISGVGTG